MGAHPLHTPSETELRAAALAALHAGRSAQDVLEVAVRSEFAGRIAAVSSFGSESAVLLALLAEVAPDVPVIFLDTGKHFGETLRYRDQLVARLGLSDVRTVEPDPADVAERDPDGILWHSSANACCHIRKVLPLQRALTGLDAWITGRKRYQATTRAELALFEADGDRVKVNPLAGWDRARIDAEFAARDLPRHPLEADGFLSIGCMPCTDRVAPGSDLRSGRWKGLDKTECGIHTFPNGKTR